MKKKLFYQTLSLVTVVALSVSMTGCHSSAKADSMQVITNEMQVKEKTVKVSEDYVEGEIKVPVISNLSDSKVQDKINSTLKNDIMKFVDEQKSSSEYYKEDKDFTKLLISVDSKVTFKSDNLISMLISKKVNDGKDYSFENKVAYTFDLKTGKNVYLDELINGNEDYKETIKNYIEGKYKSKSNIRKSDIRDNQYYLGDGKLFIFFQEYVANEESNGKDEYEIPFQAFKEGINIQPKLEPSAVSVDSKKTRESDEYFEANIETPVISGLKDEKVQDLINKRFEEEALKFRDGIKNSAKKDHEEAQKSGYNLNKYSAYVSFEEKRNQGDLLSIYVTYYQYTGGAHGMHNDIAYNVHLKTGKLIELKDLFKEDVDYKKIIDSKIKEQIKALNEDEKNFLVKSGQKEEDFYPVYEGFDGISENQSCYLTDDKLGIYFGLYEIAPYAAGVPTFEISLNDLSEYMKPIQ